MANLNANIASKLISYVRHGVDINSEIKNIYRNSLIFIGDENQIYVPAMNTYVGIGQTAYTNTLERIKTIETQISELGTTLSADLVSKIYVNYSLDEVNGLNGHHSIGDAGAGLSAEEWALNNEITIKGVGDYDEATGFNKKNTGNNSSRYHTYTANHYDNGTGTKEIYVTYSDYYNSASSQPTSGITVTPYWGGKTTVTNPTTGQTITKRIGSYITIDDKLTWSYMTSAYSYALNYTRLHTASEIDRLYHNLLGDSVATYLPVGFGIAIENRTDQIKKLTPSEIANYNTANPNKYLVTVDPSGSDPEYYVLDKDAVYYYAYISNNTPAEGTTGNKVYVEISYSDIANLLTNGLGSLHNGTIRYNNGDSDIVQFPQLYVKDTQYNTTYNINIADGIQTLKEVAYLLDILSDGSLGSVTYYTYAEYNALTTNEKAECVYILPQNPNPASADIYAYSVNTGNPENLGIQIAYSIAGNQAQITDLHSHIEKIEKGKTSIRSIQGTNTEFTTVSVQGQLNWENTDTDQGRIQQGHPNYDGAGGHRDTPSYMVGDVNFKIAINTGLVYATVYQSGSSPKNYLYTDGFGVDWYGYYTAADMRNLSNESELVGGTAYSSYYTITIGTESGTGYTYANFTRIPSDNLVLDSYKQGENIQYYWIPNKAEAKNNASQNIIWEKVTREQLIALADTDTLPNSSITKGACTDFYTLNGGIYTNVATAANGHNAAYNAINNQTNVNVFYFQAGHKEFVIHAKVGENKIATTEWVGAYVEDSIRDISNTIGNIVEEANNYTKRKIEALDTNYIYSDFATYWTAYVATNNLTPGTTLYETAYANEYADYIARAADETRVFGNSGDYRLSYIAKSHYTYNIIEEDGIVRAETRELPSDTIKASAEIWGAESNVSITNRHQYAELINNTAYTPLYETLYNWKHETTQDNQLFVPVTNGTKVALAPAVANPWLSQRVYILNESDGAFIEFNRAATGAMQNYTDVANKAWQQLYVDGVRYDELDLNDWAWLDNNHTILRVGNYILTKVTSGANAGKISATAITDGTSYTYVSYISTTASTSTQYFSVEQKHFTYANAGNGENQLSVKAHITRIEDARSNNTGFADAYDVQKYIESLFTWVDISATATEAIINSSDKYYKHITLEDYNGENLYKRTLNGASPQYTYESTPVKAYFWKDNNAYFELTSNTTDTPDSDSNISHAGHVTVDGKYVYEQFFADYQTAQNYTRASNYYVRTEEPIINPLNLTETLYK